MKQCSPFLCHVQNISFDFRLLFGQNKTFPLILEKSWAFSFYWFLPFKDSTLPSIFSFSSLCLPFCPCLNSPTLSPSCVFFEPHVGAFVAVSRASYSRHSWDSCWTRGKRQAELLLGCQSVRFSYCCYLDCGVCSPPHQSVDTHINLASLIIISVSCQPHRRMRMYIKSDRKQQLWPWEDNTFNKAVLMWGTQNPTTKDTLKTI